MAIVLFRVDERLIHGQVVIGWGHQLWPDRYILVDDELATSDWEQELYQLGAGGAGVVFSTTESARSRIAEWREAGERSILLTRDIDTMRRLAEDGILSGERVNLGGIHHGPGRDEVLNYLHLTAADRESLKAIAAEGVEVSARDLPDSHRVSLQTLLKG
ncbi:MAG: PTS sugar transporter subunit IIB [Gemmatimonadetes bacterium]|nr:PTS sugar transporter subunit IIB [Gemmatimonadota bacterium]MDA1104726.1 PTS sugar transporter subunit IIB [Gemmatimonadota bacterium]